MADPSLPADLAATLRDYQTRLDRLERASVSPLLNLPTRQVASPVAVTSSTAVGTWEAAVGFVSSTSVRWVSQLGVDAATTGSAYLLMGLYDESGTQVEAYATSTVSLPAGAISTVSFSWSPGWTTGDPALRAFFQLQVARTSGVGTVYSYTPISFFTASAPVINATASGI